MVNISNEISYQTTRSGGKGGQNVNKVETAVIASFEIDASEMLSPEQKEILHVKLANRISKEGLLQVKAQTHRTQLSNRAEAAKRIQELVNSALEKKKSRIATRVSKASKEKRLESKKIKAQIKSGRQKFRPGEIG